jgi:small subunit ribosomal protein S9
MPKPLVQATGRRKSSVARVRLYPGTGKYFINGERSLENYFPQPALQIRVAEPLRITESEARYDVYVQLEGGGFTGQSDALRLGIARALVGLDRDARKVERKKYGLRKARRAPQFTKR